MACSYSTHHLDLCGTHFSDTEASLSSQCSRDDLYSYTSKLPSPVILCSFLCHGKTHFILFESWPLPLETSIICDYILYFHVRVRVCVCDFKLLCMVNWWLIYEASVLLMSSVSVVVSSQRVSLRKQVDRLLAAALCVDLLILPRECRSVRAFTTDDDGLRNTVLHWWHSSTLSCVLHSWQYTTLFYTDDSVQHCSTLSCVLHWWQCSTLVTVFYTVMCFTLRTVFYTVMYSIEQHGTELSFLPASGKITARKHYFLCASAWMPEPQSSIPVWTFLCVCVCGDPSVWCMLFALWLILLHVHVQEASLNYKTVVVEHSRWTSRHKPWVVFRPVWVMFSTVSTLWTRP